MTQGIEISKQIYEGIASAKQSLTFHYQQLVPPSVKMEVVKNFTDANFIILEPVKDTLIFTWIGSRKWYQSMTGKSSYDRVKASDLICTEICKLIPDNSTIKFLNPKLVTPIINKFNAVTGEVESTFKNKVTVTNQLMSVISKYKD